MVTVLFTALIGGMSLGQAAPNLKYFQNGRIAGARVFKIITRCSVHRPASTGHNAVDMHLLHMCCTWQDPTGSCFQVASVSAGLSTTCAPVWCQPTGQPQKA